MDKLKMHTPNRADENFRKLCELFPSAVTEALDENGEVVRAIDKDVLMQEIAHKVVEGREQRYQFTWPDKRQAVLSANAPIDKTLRPVREDETVPTGADSSGKPYCSSGSVDFDTTENLYIEGDNLEVLKLLQETYLGKIKMIYIDPPYNTGNDFVYNDDFAESVDDYLGGSGQFDEEGNRLVPNLESNGRFHTDWLNMIYPRLRIAKDFLSDDGVIFISIDDHEVSNLTKIGKEIFGEDCFVADISWQRTYSTRNDSKGIVSEVEHIIVFSKQPNWSPNKLPRTEAMDSIYKNPDNDVEPWTSDNPFAPGAATHQGMVYAIQHPFTGEMIYPSTSACWRYQQNEMLNIMSGWCSYQLEDLHDEDERARVCGIPKSEVRKGVKGIILAEPLEVSRNKAQQIYDRGQWPKFYFTKNGLGGVRRKTYLSAVGGRLPTNFWPYVEAGHTDEAKKEILALFDKKAPFDTPKPTRLLDRIITIATDNNSIVLDFFSGSATTAHAVMMKNVTDNGQRKFILVQLPEKSKSSEYENICEIGKERIRRAAKKIAEEHPEAKFDGGFRVLKCDSSNMKPVYYTPDEYEPSLFESLTDNIKEDRTPEDLLFQVMLDLGVLPSSKIEESVICDKRVFNVAENFLIACFDSDISDEVVTAIAKQHPYYAVFRDSGMASDSVMVNFEQIFKAYSPDTVRRVL